MSVNEYEMRIVRFLNRIIKESLLDEIKQFRNAECILNDRINKPLIRKQKCMRLENGLYSPRMDVAVGPFAFSGYRFANIDESNYEQLLVLQEVNNFAEKLIDYGRMLPGFTTNYNRNPRCLFSIEIENANDYKHNLGSIANASIMGKIGVYIDYNTRRLNHFYDYLSEMIRRKKVEIYLNVIFLTRTEFNKLMRSY